MKKSPFPGMDPWLEGYLWPDVHNSLAFVIKELLGPQIAPKYVARIEPYIKTDPTPESETGITYQYLALFERNTIVREPELAYGIESKADRPDLVIPSIKPVEIRIPTVEIRDVAKNRLIAAIEILSPVNKKKPGVDEYHEKRLALHLSGVHLLEIDLLRRGIRPLAHPQLPKSDYLMLLMRAGAYQTEAWTVKLQDVLPTLPVPLAAPDPDATLDLKAALDLVYTRGLYHLSVDYRQLPPPPELPAETLEWVNKFVTLEKII
jgi:Protein of unknown function (DUF4058)